jgi:hypothetical protein
MDDKREQDYRDWNSDAEDKCCEIHDDLSNLGSTRLPPSSRASDFAVTGATKCLFVERAACCFRQRKGGINACAARFWQSCSYALATARLRH